MTAGHDPLDDRGPQAPVHRGQAGGTSPAGHDAGRGSRAGDGAGAEADAARGHVAGSTPRREADTAPVPTDPAAIAERIAGQRRMRSFLVGSMVVGDIAVIAIAWFFLEPPARWFVLAVGVLGFAAAAYMWTIVSKPIKRLEHARDRATGNPHYPGA
ncbi:MAG: hypothetical protein ACTHW7_12840 [Actinomycetaceae bacterium]